MKDICKKKKKILAKGVGGFAFIPGRVREGKTVATVTEKKN